MSTCFVMQPFDGDVYDKRYETVFAPAITAADLEPYRVDRDPGVSVPINSIEKGIRSAQLCFAEITTDNPNVWFELGFAFAAGKDVVMVCCEERKTHFPFDVQHRSIIKYRAGAPQDFEELCGKITTRIKALIDKQREIAQASSLSPMKDTEGLAQHEIVALVAILENELLSPEGVAAWVIRKDMNTAGFTNVAASLAIKSLLDKEMIRETEAWDLQNNERYTAYLTGESGNAWLLANQHRLVLRNDGASRSDKADGDLPF